MLLEDPFFISFFHTPLETLVTTVQTTGVPTRIVMIVDRRSAVSSMSVCVWKRGMWIVLPDNDPVRLQLDMVFNFRWKRYAFPIPYGIRGRVHDGSGQLRYSCKLPVGPIRLPCFLLSSDRISIKAKAKLAVVLYCMKGNGKILMIWSLQ